MAKTSTGLTSEEWLDMAYKVENEGWDYFFSGYTSADAYPYSKDRKLVKLWTAYTKAEKALKDYTKPKMEAALEEAGQL